MRGENEGTLISTYICIIGDVSSHVLFTCVDVATRHMLVDFRDQ